MTATALGRRLSAAFGWRRPQTLLVTGLVVGFCWALFFNGFLGAKLGVFYYGRVISGLAIREGTIHQYPLYDSLAMAIQMMVFTYLLGRTDIEGRNVIEVWSATRSETRAQASILSVVALAFEEVLKRWPDWDVDYTNAGRAHTASVRGWARLPVVTR